MVTDLFSSILNDLGNILKISDLHPDRNNSCLINLANDVKIQIEVDKTGQFLIIASEIGQVPQGRYRENVFREALRSNGMPAPRNGTFAYQKS